MRRAIGEKPVSAGCANSTVVHRHFRQKPGAVMMRPRAGPSSCRASPVPGTPSYLEPGMWHRSVE
jgi:hypothetical protein